MTRRESLPGFQIERAEAGLADKILTLRLAVEDKFHILQTVSSALTGE
jgi:hypothetical protein